MWWELPDGTKGLGALSTADLPLYGSQLLRNHPDEEMPIVCEGEKATQALIRRGLPAVGTVCGAAATPSDESLRPLVRFANITLWPDNDDPGRAHMGRVAGILARMGAKNIRVVAGLCDKCDDAADLSDVSVFREAIAAAKDWRPSSSDLIISGKTGDVPALIIPWETRSLAEVANEAYLKRTAVVDKLLYTSSVSMVTGGKHAGKSTLVRWMAICVAKGLPFLDREVTQGPVFYIASEDETMAARQELIRLGWNDQDPLRFLSNSDIEDQDAFLSMLAGEIRREGAVLTVLDMLFDFVRISDEMSYAGTRGAVGEIQRVATEGGSHIVTVHHAPKNALISEAAVAALGSQGLAARVSPIILVRRFGPGVHSISSTSVRDPRGEQIADSRLVKNSDGSVILGGAFKIRMLTEIHAPRIKEFLAEEPGSEFTAGDIKEQLDLSYEVARACLANLYKSGEVERTGAGKKGKPFRYAVYAPDISATNEKNAPTDSPTSLGNVEKGESFDFNASGRFGFKD
jgi:hypothetical protein